MHEIIARAPAKLNLTFDIVGTLPNGYHEVETLYQTVALEDELSFEFDSANATTIEVIASGPEAGVDFPTSESNLISKAAGYFLSSLPGSPTVAIKVAVEKNIPIAAGMAGGSSDAAATLVALNRYFEHPFGKEELLALAGKLGADVPFCMEGGTCLGKGRGDDLTAVRPSPSLAFLIVKPDQLLISTPWAYRAFDEFTGIRQRPNLEGTVEALLSGDLEFASDSMGNAFEPLVFNSYPFLADLQKLLLKSGAWCAHLTGKGPTLFALAENRQMAAQLHEQFLQQVRPLNDDWAQQIKCWVVESVQYGARLTAERMVHAS